MMPYDERNYSYYPQDHTNDNHQQQAAQDPPNVSPIDERSHFPPSASLPPPPPPPPAHRHPSLSPGNSYMQHQNERQYGIPVNQRRESLVTPGMDNVGERAVGGGVTGLAYGVASNANERDNAPQALRDIDNWGRSGNSASGRRYDASDQPYPSRDVPASLSGTPQLHSQASRYSSNSSGGPFSDAAYAMSTGSPATRSERSLPWDQNQNASQDRFNASHPYAQNPYNRWSDSHSQLAAGAHIDPNTIEDDGEDFPPETSSRQRRSMLPFAHRSTSQNGLGTAAAAGAVGGVAAGGAALSASHDAGGRYAPVGVLDGAYPNEKSEWLEKEAHGRKRMKWLVGIAIGFIIIGAIVGGILGGVVFKGKSANTSTSNGQSAADDAAQNGDLDKNSKEIQALMNNSELKKVFPGMDYTPINSQYPECIKNPPSQNNVTRDVAVLSQLTNAIRLYGTDCNQTEMVLHALDRLSLPDVKVWLGVHLDSNSTTNERQVSQMWSILDTYGDDRFKGIIVGNEVLYRKDLTITQFAANLSEIRTNMTKHGINLPLAAADLGDNWTAELAADVDIVMSNIHPFFAGVTAEAASGWTWSFWNEKDLPLTAGNSSKKQIVSEVGWPSAGGNSCGSATCTSETQGSIAGIDEMNTFMENYVCQSLANGTEFFWFEAFDEPWKIQFNEPDKGREWEDKWGLMDVNRNLKKGVRIPDCAGQSI
ncbi:glycoside hydrolase [Pseudovirgaria hyperparasitica]|uniref:glucan endo-1,3-beta-D-glucosidase n=1 Tax=Pseudovirgaria hyperparasitica TaxID=470096 RepID=A0A6A6WBK8_9PEZI|nr:glycoside hydrolase [Pseudovirgaria hyperparasitica]KAF2758987.1 glycoside hydrolase [Pseudovirgaria hyperparasitica]